MKDKTTINYERRIALNDMKAKKAAADMKALYQQGQKLKRDARTHRLCNLGGLLESYLKEPELLDPDDVKVILDAVFSDTRFARALAGNASMIASRASGRSLWLAPAIFPNAQNRKRRTPTEWNMNL